MNEKIKTVKEWLHNTQNVSFLILYFAMPFWINFIIDCLGRRSFTAGVVFYATHPLRFFCNAMIILLTVSVTMLFRRRIFLASAVYIVWLIFGISNYVLLCNRVTPFTADDLKLIEDAFAVMNKYLNIFGLIAVGAGACLAVLLLVLLWIKDGKHSERIPLLRACGIIFLICVTCFSGLWIGTVTDALEVQFGELSQSYLRNGFVYCFSNSVVNTGVKRPRDYSEETIKKILASLESLKDPSTGLSPENPPESVDQAENPDTQTPNIIIVQLESFFDITDVTDMTFTTDPLPNFHAMMQEYDSGHLSMPCVGAGTCNSEFEMLTGMNLDDFGPGEYPYKSILKSTTCESTAYNLKEFGYSTHAIHNNTGRFYSRNIVFSNFGFDTFTSVEFMDVTDEDRTPTGWAKDFVLTDEILQTLASTDEQDFIYTISVQGHGSYPSDLEYEKKVQTVEIGNESIREATDYYINQIYEMDQFVGELINALSNLGEDTVLVMYGDHLPSLGFTDEQMSTGSVYNSVYFIWNNMGLDYGDEDLEAYQLSSKVLAGLGIDSGVINRYHQQNRGTEDYLEGLQYLEYDILYGDKLCYDGLNPYNATDLQMGIREITITDVYPDPTNTEIENCVVIKGENFTGYSRVYVNEQRRGTTFVDSNTLLISFADLSGLDSFVVWQSALSSTDEFFYYGSSEHPGISDDEGETVIEEEAETESETQAAEAPAQE